MNSIDKVLFAIKAECGRQTRLAEVYCLERIAIRAGLRTELLMQYLDELQQKGLIEYSAKDCYIYMTREGKRYAS